MALLSSAHIIRYKRRGMDGEYDMACHPHNLYWHPWNAAVVVFSGLCACIVLIYWHAFPGFPSTQTIVFGANFVSSCRSVSQDSGLVIQLLFLPVDDQDRSVSWRLAISQLTLGYPASEWQNEDQKITSQDFSEYCWWQHPLHHHFHITTLVGLSGRRKKCYQLLRVLFLCGSGCRENDASLRNGCNEVQCIGCPIGREGLSAMSAVLFVGWKGGRTSVASDFCFRKKWDLPMEPQAIISNRSTS